MQRPRFHHARLVADQGVAEAHAVLVVIAVEEVVTEGGRIRLTILVDIDQVAENRSAERVRGSTPFDNLPLSPGPHLIQVEVPSTGRVWSREVTLEPGEHLELVFD